MTQLILTTLLAGLAPVAEVGPTPATPVEPLAAEVFVTEDVAALIEEFEAAWEAWLTEFRATETGAQRAALVEKMPAKLFWSRFEGPAAEGDPQANLWLLENASNAQLKPEEMRSSLLDAYRILFLDHVDKPAILGQAGETFDLYTGLLPTAELVDVLHASFSAAEVHEAKAVGAYYLGTLLARSGDEEQQVEGRGWLQRVADEFGDTVYAARAGDVLFELENLVVGATAPVFGGQTVDGAELKLEDYRGQIVVLDFFGFW